MKSKKTAELGIFLALSAGILFIVYYNPLLVLFGYLFIPLPIILYSVKYKDFKSCILLIILAYIVSLLYIPITDATFIFFNNAAIALPLSYTIIKDKGWLYSILSTTLIQTIIIIITFLVILQTSNIDIQKTMQENIEKIKQIYTLVDKEQKNNLSLQESEKFILKIIKDKKIFTSFIFSIFFLSNLVNVFILYYFLTIIAKKLNFKINNIKEFKLWKWDWYVATGYILSLILIGLKNKIPSLFIYGTILFITFSFIYLITAISIIYFFLDKFLKREQKYIKIILTIFILMLFGINLSFIGLLDTWFNFRRLKDI